MRDAVTGSGSKTNIADENVATRIIRLQQREDFSDIIHRVLHIFLAHIVCPNNNYDWAELSTKLCLILLDL